MNKLRETALAMTVMFLLAGHVEALLVVPRDFDHLVARAESVFKGTVIEQRCEWQGEGETRRIMTLVTLQVEDTYKGEPSATQIIQFLGGTVDGQSMEIEDMPKFFVGGTYVLFVVGNGTQFCPLVGIFQGQFQIHRDITSGEERVFDWRGAAVRHTESLGKTESADGTDPKVSQSAGPALTSADFRNQIMNKLREQAANPSQIRADD